MSIYHFCIYHGLCEKDAVGIARFLRQHMTGELEQWLNDTEFFVEFRQDIIDDYEPDELTIEVLDLMLLSTMLPADTRRLYYMKGVG